MLSSLAGTHAHLAERHGAAARYPADVAVFAALDLTDPDAWRHLANLMRPVDSIGVCAAAVPSPTDGVVEAFRGFPRQLVCEVEPRADPIEVIELGPEDWDEMRELVALAKPGPFRDRTPILGTYLGIREHGRLIAMAGERMRPAGATEISAVCTHPDARRRGLAGALTAELARRIQARGELPFLHVAPDNPGAERVYTALGFEFRRTIEFVGVELPAG